MSPKSKKELSHTDVKFLKAVREVEDDPDSYPGTDATDRPANTSVLKHVLDLNEQQIRYRMRPSPNGRGFDDVGYAEIFDPELLPGGRLGPRSITLTDKGRKTLVDWEKRHGEVDIEDLTAATAEELSVEIDNLRDQLDLVKRQVEAQSRDDDVGADLQERVEALQSQVNAISEKVQEFDDSELGAMDETHAEYLSETIDYYSFLFGVLGAPVESEPQDVDFDDEELKAEIREAVRDTLRVHQEGSDEGGGGQSSDNDGGSSGPDIFGEGR